MRGMRKVYAAFTLLEAVVVLMIVGILLALLVPNFSTVRAKSEGVVCTGRLKNLWTAFSLQLQDGKGWPQLPVDIKIGSEEEQRWWLEYSSNNLGLTSREWNCPTISRSQQSATNREQVMLISYLPTLFDAKPSSPGKWPRMPWFTESQSAHGDGILCIRADGTVNPVSDQ
jgi:type II secretory pathway pseudopilin PulG